MSTHPPVPVEEDSIASTTESSSTHMNLDEVHLVNADSRNQFSSSLKTVAFETPSDAQSFSTVRIPEVSTKENKFREAISQPSRTPMASSGAVATRRGGVRRLFDAAGRRPRRGGRQSDAAAVRRLAGDLRGHAGGAATLRSDGAAHAAQRVSAVPAFLVDAADAERRTFDFFRLAQFEHRVGKL